MSSQEQLLVSLRQLVLILFNPLVLIPVAILVVILVKKDRDYKKGAYHQITKLPYHSVIHDTGRYGEYLIYEQLKHFETKGAKFLFNIYVPKGNGETTEIDVLMICSKGVFVFESKNYSGWIFGSENQQNWHQTLPKGRGRSHKEHFYNPIMQNRSHIKHLHTFLGEQVPMWSIIVFSNRCTLKSIQVKSKDTLITKRHSVAQVIASIYKQLPTDWLTENDITSIYNTLYPYTQLDAMAKAQHIANIHSNLNPSSVRQIPPTFIPSTPTEPLQATSAEQATPDNLSQPESDPVVENPDDTKPATVEAEPEKPDKADDRILKCPKCNGTLVLRTAARGANAGNRFYGCSNYPRCKYIQNITDKSFLTASQGASNHDLHHSTH